MAHFGYQPVFGTFNGSNPSLSSERTLPADLWTLDGSSPQTTNLHGRITPEIVAASQEIRSLTLALGVPLQMLFCNFVRYTLRVRVPVSTENFIFYLKNWADLDLRIGASDVDSSVQKETLLKKIQRSNNPDHLEEIIKEQPAKPIKILKRPQNEERQTKREVRAVIRNGTTFYEVEKPAAATKMSTKSGLSHEDLRKLNKVRFGSTVDVEKSSLKRKSKAELSPEQVLKMKEEAKRVFAQKLAEYYK